MPVSPGDLPIVRSTKHLCLALCGVLIALVRETYQSLRAGRLARLLNMGLWCKALRDDGK